MSHNIIAGNVARIELLPGNSGRSQQSASFQQNPGFGPRMSSKAKKLEQAYESVTRGIKNQ